MATVKFEVGNNEKHSVTVEATAPWLRKLKVVVDGKEVVNKVWSKSFGGSAEITVGEGERHQVEVRVNGQFTPKIEVTVDGTALDVK